MRASTLIAATSLLLAGAAHAQAPPGAPVIVDGSPQLVDMDRENPLRFGTMYDVAGADSYEFCLEYVNDRLPVECHTEDVRESPFDILAGHIIRVRVRAWASGLSGPWSDYDSWIKTATADSNRDGIVGVPDFQQLSDQFGTDYRE